MPEWFVFEPQRYAFLRKLPKITKAGNGENKAISATVSGRRRPFFQARRFSTNP
jgi:hypothetical protein